MEEKKMIINGHEAVDLGLSVKWATCNIGASRPEEYGDYFAWGETKPKDKYSYENYMFYNATNGSHLIHTGAIISGTKFDAVHKLWGEDWRMPTEWDLYELLRECSWERAIINGGKGYRVIGPNGNCIFLPAEKWNPRYNENEGVQYWTGSFSDDDSHWDALCLCPDFDNDEIYSTYVEPYDGLLIRPVKNK